MESIIEKHSIQKKGFKQLFTIPDNPIYSNKFKAMFQEAS